MAQGEEREDGSPGCWTEPFGSSEGKHAEAASIITFDDIT